MNEIPISIILPTYNSAQFLPRTIESVLQQDYENFELLVLDNASVDDTPSIVSRYKDTRIRSVRHSANLGMVGNINYGIAASHGKFGIILCADDHWLPSFLSCSVQNQLERPGLTFTNSAVLQGGCEGLIRNVFHGIRTVSPWRLVRHLHGVPLSSLMFPLGSSREFFDERLPFNCDLEFVLRLLICRDLPLTFIDWPGVLVNIHAGNETHLYNVRDENIKLLEVLLQYTPYGALRMVIALQLSRLRYA